LTDNDVGWILVYLLNSAAEGQGSINSMNQHKKLSRFVPFMMTLDSYLNHVTG